MSQEQNSSKQKLEEELGQLVLSLLKSDSDQERAQCLRLVESTLRRLVILSRETRPE
jgi:hypothetical protein